MTRRDRYLLSKYGITEAEYDKLVDAGGGGCWVCGHHPTGRSLHVDHNHKERNSRKSVRGLLDWRCNAGLARFSDDPARLRAAANYLESNTAQEVLDA